MNDAAPTETSTTDRGGPDGSTRISAPIPATMRAAAYRRYGRPEEVVRLETIATPTLDDSHDVLVRVEASVVGRGDWRLVVADPFVVRLMQGFSRIKQPVLGYGLAGRVVAVGSAVRSVGIGDRVFGESAKGGGFAEFARIAHERLARVPDDVAFDAAAATPVAGFTALQAVRDHGRLPKDGRALVIGAGGAVGSAAVAIAKHLGGHVSAIDGASKRAGIEALGADHFFDRASTDVAELVRSDERFDTIVDTVGNAKLGDCKRALTANGRYVAVSGALSRTLWATMFGGPRLVGMVARPNADDLELLRGWLADGVLAPKVQHHFPLAETGEALRTVGSGGLLGAVVVMPGRDDSART